MLNHRLLGALQLMIFAPAVLRDSTYSIGIKLSDHNIRAYLAPAFVGLPSTICIDRWHRIFQRP